MHTSTEFTAQILKKKVPEIFTLAGQTTTQEAFMEGLSRYIHQQAYATRDSYGQHSEQRIVRMRDCASVLTRMLNRRAEDRADFSLTQALWDLARGKERPDLAPAFYAEIMYLFLGLAGRETARSGLTDSSVPASLEGRAAAVERSKQLDLLAEAAKSSMSKYESGLAEAAIQRRALRREKILSHFKASPHDWDNWQWHIAHIIRDRSVLEEFLTLSQDEKKSIDHAKAQKLPFGITPYYLSLMDEEPDTGRDRAIRAQVIPPLSYTKLMDRALHGENTCLDFMRESDTSPVDLITRRYPGICILKPLNTCPQICVYCQRNWEIEDAMAPGSIASQDKLEAALAWIAEHPSIHEVLVTGGDPLAIPDIPLKKILDGVAAIPSIERIRIGSRTLLTVPMRFNDDLVDMLASYRVPGKRQVALVTHVQHAYELTPDTLNAVEKLRSKGISVFNQHVYTFFSSRRFEAAFLRRQLALVGIDPYYTFNTKGKEETLEYRVPIARLLQEQKEEARLLPGLSRTDEGVYNVPGMGKNYLRALQHRDLIAILPDGARLYEFHSWEKHISSEISTHLSADVPILDYLERLQIIGEDISSYESIWYYF